MRILAICCIAPFLGGCFFIYLPPSATSAIGDSLTGNTGQHCVGEAAQIGSYVKAPDGRVGKVIKLEGTTSRCGDPRMPIRAVLEFENAPTALGPN